MPFRQPLPRSFTAVEICQHVPTISGVYGISNAAGWIFTGEATDLQEALLRHVMEPESPDGERRPAGSVFEVRQRAEREGRLNCLILDTIRCATGNGGDSAERGERVHAIRPARV